MTTANYKLKDVRVTVTDPNTGHVWLVGSDGMLHMICDSCDPIKCTCSKQEQQAKITHITITATAPGIIEESVITGEVTLDLHEIEQEPSLPPLKGN